MSRKTLLLNKHIYNTIIDYISKGNYIKTACLAAGICPESYCNWQQRANNYSPDNGTSEDKIYFQFFQDLKNAEAKAEAERTKSINEAGDKPQYWMAKAWINERKDPERWGRRDAPIVIESKVLIALQDRFSTLRSIDVAQQTLSDVPQESIEDKKLLSEGVSDDRGE